ncbi:Uncharacterized protein TCM_028479 [Theobroma cacao]|uniref:CCHC-type domain-containing protein n=1 Tax=Theobroma cacao TaxID=3641 RepID=A0A061GAL7_THECC|nr:Uncharacterized protein TCM_028479 [Theobroma cacao]
MVVRREVNSKYTLGDTLCASHTKIIMSPRRETPPLTRSVGRGRGRFQRRQLGAIEEESSASTIRAAPAVPPAAPSVPSPSPLVPPLVLDVSDSKKLKEARQHSCVSFMGESDATVAKEVVQMALRAEKLANENKSLRAELAKRRNLSVSSSQPPKRGKDSYVSGSSRRYRNCGNYHVGLCRGLARCFRCDQPSHIRRHCPQLGWATVAAPSPPAHTDMQKRDSSRLQSR